MYGDSIGLLVGDHSALALDRLMNALVSHRREQKKVHLSAGGLNGQSSSAAGLDHEKTIPKT